MKAISDLQTLNALKISFNWDLSYDLDFVEDLKQIGINCNNFEIIVNSTGLRLSDILDNGFNTISCESIS